MDVQSQSVDGLKMSMLLDISLSLACQLGDVGAVEDAIRRGANVNSRCYMLGMRPLIIACENGHCETAQVLIKAGANIEATDQNGTTPLMIACENGHSETAQVLIKAGANIEATDWVCVTLLVQACLANCHDIVLPLIEAGARPFLRVNAGVFVNIPLKTVMYEDDIIPLVYKLVNEKLEQIQRKIMLRITQSLVCDSAVLVCLSLGELVSLLKCLHTGCGPPLDLLTRMVNSRFWVMEADMWADLLIIARWSNAIINPDNVRCTVCKLVWVKPTTLGCGHIFCMSCVQSWISDHKECPTCQQQIEVVLPFNQAAETILENYHQERDIPAEDLILACVKGGIQFISPPNKRESSTKRSVMSPNQHSNEDMSIPSGKRRKISHDTGPVGVRHVTVDNLKRRYSLSARIFGHQIKETDLFHLGGLFGAWNKYAENPGLGLTDGERHTITADKDLVDNRMRMVAALKTWQRPNPLKATFQNLVGRVLQLEEGIVAESICKYLVSSRQDTDPLIPSRNLRPRLRKK